jgi:hypothetical protein
MASANLDLVRSIIDKTDYGAAGRPGGRCVG